MKSKTWRYLARIRRCPARRAISSLPFPSLLFLILNLKRKPSLQMNRYFRIGGRCGLKSEGRTTTGKHSKRGSLSYRWILRARRSNAQPRISQALTIQRRVSILIIFCSSKRRISLGLDGRLSRGTERREKPGRNDWRERWMLNQGKLLEIK